MDFELIGDITHAETFTVGAGIREIARLKSAYGGTRWRKRKGKATVRLPDGSIVTAEVHWYQCHGVGRRELKVKRILGGQS